MANLIQLTADLVSAHASNTQMTGKELYQEIEKVYASLKALENGTSVETPEQPKQLTMKQAFKKNEVICMICGKGGFKTLKRHIAQAHDLKPGAYRKQFGIPSTQSLVAKNYSESRRQSAIDKGLGDGLARARATQKANAEAKNAKVPVVKIKAPLPAVKVKALVPAVKKKSAVPAKVEVTKAPVKAKKPSSAKPTPKAKK